MSKAESPIPADQQTLTPHIVIKETARAIEFYKWAFGATEISRFKAPDGRIMHADLKIGESHLFLAGEFPEYGGCLSPLSLTGTNATMHLFVEDVDKAYQRALDAGAIGVMAPQNMFWGNRYARFVDPFGQPWSMASHLEDLTQKDIEIRGSEFF
jgi:PhnB protein